MRDHWVIPASPEERNAGEEKGWLMGTTMCCPFPSSRGVTEWNPLQKKGILGKEAGGVAEAKLSPVKWEERGRPKICLFVCFPSRMEFQVNC